MEIMILSNNNLIRGIISDQRIILKDTSSNNYDDDFETVIERIKKEIINSAYESLGDNLIIVGIYNNYGKEEKQ